jgi:hypothetical protein
MSFKDQHINITRDNYEEYFLLYIDDELSATEKKMVDNFVLVNPDLSEEFDLLKGTKLDGDSILFGNKESLLSSRFEMDAVDESLLLFLDNELDEKERSRVEFELQNNPNYYNGYQQLKSAKLDPLTENITCPFKNELYHSESNRRFVWLRIAAVAILLIGAGTLVILNTNRNVEPPVAHYQKPPVQITSPFKPTEIAPAQQVIAEEQAAIEPTEKYIARKTSSQHEEHPAVQNPQQLPEQQIARLTPDEINTARTNVIEPSHVAGNSEKIKADTVTNQAISSYNSIAGTTEAAPQTEPDGSNGKQRSVRGLLRKATRFIEHRTGINAVNDDDKLLVGMVAINLK